MNRFLTTHKNWIKIQNYARASYDNWKAEIGGMAVMLNVKKKTDNFDEGDWILVDPVILKQTVSGGNCDLDKDALAEYYGRFAMKYKDYQFRFCWWHSHHTMDAFWSSTDLEAIQEFSDGDISFALVVNLKQEYKFRVSIWKPIEVHQDVDFEIYDRIAKKIPKTILTEVDKLCSKEISTIGSYKGYSTHGYRALNQGQLFGNTYNSEKSTTQTDAAAHLASTPEDIGGYCDLVEIAKSLNSRYIMGEIKYNTYKKKVEKTNNEALEQGLDFEIKLLSKNELFDAIQHADDQDFVEYNGWGGHSYGI